MNQKTELEELKVLQKESNELRERQKKPAPDTTAAPDPGMHEESASAIDQEGALEGFTGEVETIMAELEEAAAAHPRLALLAAFGIGIFAGQLLSRR